ncbi:MAG: hypothetical protein IJ092_13440 [Atopobiaceae bacterium]|nr:hypothetical protein [Atopobiaceae bacterium]
MLYVANFSYTDANEEDDNYCLMPAIVEATDADTALELFSDMLRRMHDESNLLVGAKDIYLDSLVELNRTPQDAIMLQWQKVITGDDGLYSVLSVLPEEESLPGVYSWSETDQWGAAPTEPDDLQIDLTDGEGDEEISAEELADAITEALDLLIAGEASAMDDEDFADTEEAFLSFGDEE